MFDFTVISRLYASVTSQPVLLAIVYVCCVAVVSEVRRLLDKRNAATPSCRTVTAPTTSSVSNPTNATLDSSSLVTTSSNTSNSTGNVSASNESTAVPHPAVRRNAITMASISPHIAAANTNTTSSTPQPVVTNSTSNVTSTPAVITSGQVTSTSNMNTSTTTPTTNTNANTTNARTTSSPSASTTSTTTATPTTTPPAQKLIHGMTVAEIEKRAVRKFPFQPTAATRKAHGLWDLTAFPGSLITSTHLRTSLLWEYHHKGNMCATIKKEISARIVQYASADKLQQYLARLDSSLTTSSIGRIDDVFVQVLSTTDESVHVCATTFRTKIVTRFDVFPPRKLRSVKYRSTVFALSVASLKWAL